MQVEITVVTALVNTMPFRPRKCSITSSTGRNTSPFCISDVSVA